MNGGVDALTVLASKVDGGETIAGTAGPQAVGGAGAVGESVGNENAGDGEGVGLALSFEKMLENKNFNKAIIYTYGSGELHISADIVVDDAIANHLLVQEQSVGGVAGAPAAAHGKSASQDGGKQSNQSQ